MAERVVSVRLSAKVDEYKKGMLEAANATRTVGSEAEKLAQTREAMNLLGGASLAMGAALAAGLGVAVKKFADFDQAMSFVAATGDDARESIDGLRDAALDAGSRTVFSATEAANAIEELAKAGLDATDILGGGLDGALDLAAAGGLGVADAAGIAATALKVFNLNGSDMSHVADLLAAGAGKAMGDVTDLSAALAQGGQVASATGLSIEETTATLAAFASQGLLGSDAGTSFKTMLQRLTPQSAEAKKKMDELGVSAYDAQGQFIGMADFAGNLQDALKDLTPEQRNAALSVMFGSDAVRAANVLYAEGEQGIRDWTEAVDDQGYAAETAATRLDNLMGDWEAFTGALDAAFIGMGEGANGPLRLLVQGLTDVVDAFNNLPDGAQQAVFWTGAVVAAVAAGAGAFLLAVPKVAAYNAAIATMGPTAQKASSIVMGALKFAAAAAAFLAITKGAETAADALGQMGEGAKTANETMALLLDQDYDGMFKGMTAGTDGINEMSDALDKLLASDPGTAFNRWGSDVFAFTGLKSSVGEAREQFALMGDALGQLVTQGESARAEELFNGIAAAAEEQGYSVEQVKDLMPGYEDALAGVNNENKIAEGVTRTAADAYMEQVDAVQSLADNLMSLIDAIDQANGMNRDAVTANIDYQNTLRGLDEQIANIRAGAEGYAATLDITTQAGADNKAMLVALSQDAWNAAAAQLQLDGDTAAFTTTLEAQRQKLYDAAKAMGASDDEAAALRDTLLGMPDAKAIQVIANTTDAATRLADLKARLDALPENKYTRVTLETLNVGGRTISAPQANGGFYQRGQYANSGFEPGIYPYTPGGIDKFAEQYAEAYISLDPARRARSESVWVRTGQELGMFSGSGGSSQPPVVYVQNPFTGEYLLAQVAGVADDRIGSYDDSLASTVRRGRRTI